MPPDRINFYSSMFCPYRDIIDYELLAAAVQLVIADVKRMVQEAGCTAIPDLTRVHIDRKEREHLTTPGPGGYQIIVTMTCEERFTPEQMAEMEESYAQ